MERLRGRASEVRRPRFISRFHGSLMDLYGKQGTVLQGQVADKVSGLV